MNLKSEKVRLAAKAEAQVCTTVAKPEDFDAVNMAKIIGTAMLRQYGYYCYRVGNVKFYVEVAK